LDFSCERSICISDGLIFSLFPGLIAETTISPVEDEVSGTEGQSVTLSCTYMTTSDYAYLYWYKHLSDLQAPHSAEYIPDKRYGSQTSETSTTLTIRELTLADTALYYCASWSATPPGVDGPNGSVSQNPSVPCHASFNLVVSVYVCVCATAFVVCVCVCMEGGRDGFILFF
uniref:Ig-like domain-containing protein n=1 Tax=Stegastes partitus TaxID=144197 RepID=A0A3B5AYH5_9TELE